MRTTRGALVAATLVTLAASVAQADEPAPVQPVQPVHRVIDEQPLLFSSTATSPRRDVRVELDASYGARATRVFGDHASEQRLSVEARVASWLSVRLAGGLATDGDGDGQGAALFTEVLAQPLRQDRHGVDLRVGLGYTRDYLERDVPTVRLWVGRRVGQVDLELGGAFDLHFDDSVYTREAVDVTVTASAAFALREEVRLALELTASDLEGFVEEEEAEGGARIGFGPTVTLAASEHLYLRATTALLVYATRNAPTHALAPASGPVGFLGDLAVGAAF